MNGWTRLFVVISMCWLITLGVFVFSDFREMRSEYNSHLTLPRPPGKFVIDNKTYSKFFKWQPVNLLAEGKESYVRTFAPNYPNMFTYGIVPIFFLWGVMGIDGF